MVEEQKSEEIVVSLRFKEGEDGRSFAFIKNIPRRYRAWEIKKMFSGVLNGQGITVENIDSGDVNGKEKGQAERKKLELPDF